MVQQLNDINEAAWPEERLAEAMAALVQEAGLADPTDRLDSLPGTEASTLWTERVRVDEAWIQALGDRLGIEVETSTIRLPDVDEALGALGPSLLSLAGPGPPRFLAVVRSHRKTTLVGPDRRLYRCRTSVLRDHVREPVEAPYRDEFDDVLAAAGVPESRRSRPLRRLVEKRLANEPALGVWALRVPPQASPVRQLRSSGLLHHVASLIVVYGMESLLFAASWWLLGQGALSGRLDTGWLWAWVLMLLTLVPLRSAGMWSQGIFSLGAGALLKRRLLAGAIRSEREQVRKEGAGRFLGRVIESESVETLALNGGFLGLLVVLELALAVAVLAAGSGGFWHVALLAGWLLLAAFLGRQYFHASQRWTDTRLAMTHRLVERMVGQRTRLVQEPRETWHEAEDRDLHAYLQDSQRLDRLSIWMGVLVGRGWLLLSLVALAPALIGEPSQARLAVSLGGILLAYRALERWTAGLFALADAVVAWRQVAPLFRAATRVPSPGSPSLLREVGDGDPSGPLLEATHLSRQYPGRTQPVFAGWNLQLRADDRVLLEGASGSGKSTLIALLAGLSEPQTGRVVLRGIDQRGWGSLAWRRGVAAAPQFHDNHIFVGPLAFNLLMGHAWPPTEEDLESAHAVCRGLGLGELIDRMPAGLMQPVGESGWQLSHGERSRVFIARALLQKADVVILDESFAALDAKNLATAIEFARSAAPSLMVVAHP